MTKKQLITKILEKLFDSYKANDNARLELNKFIEANGFNPNEIAIEMNKRGQLRYHQDNQGFNATISESGIEEIDPAYFPDMAINVLEFAAANGGSAFVGEALSLPPNHNTRALDIAKYIERKQLAKVQKYAVYLN